MPLQQFERRPNSEFAYTIKNALHLEIDGILNFIRDESLRADLHGFLVRKIEIFIPELESDLGTDKHSKLVLHINAQPSVELCLNYVLALDGNCFRAYHPRDWDCRWRPAGGQTNA